MSIVFMGKMQPSKMETMLFLKYQFYLFPGLTIIYLREKNYIRVVIYITSLANL